MTDIPTNASAFKAWADRECGKWPSDLQVKAYRAWVGFDSTSGIRNAFRYAYEQWQKSSAEQSQ